MSCDMTFNILRIFSSGNVEAYALPARTSGATPPLSPFKAYINELLYSKTTKLHSQGCSKSKISYFGLYSELQSAYNIGFSRQNIESGSEKKPLHGL